ncbi:hypothetical protein OH77DRAFT_1516783 [Trametes cingulata]|nr:hypothetical protein OH77DRAFT_1516783 [Trametes cingulata]
MVRLAPNLGYGDELGLRKMCQLVRGMLSQDVLRVRSPPERDLIRVDVDVVNDMPERVNGKFVENSALEGILNELSGQV